MAEVEEASLGEERASFEVGETLFEEEETLFEVGEASLEGMDLAVKQRPVACAIVQHPMS